MRTSLSPRATIDATQDWNLDRKPSSLSLQQNMIKFMKSGGPSWAETTKSNETTDDDRMTCLKNRENARSCQFLFSVWSSAWKFHVSFLMQHLFKQRSEVVLSFIRIEIDGTNLCAHDLQVDCQWFVFFSIPCCVSQRVPALSEVSWSSSGFQSLDWTWWLAQAP